MFTFSPLKQTECLVWLNVHANLLKNTAQKRIFYLSLVSSQFNHCSQIWRPWSIELINKIERVQSRAIKWILSEQNATYTSIEYLKKCKTLDLLPIRSRLDFYDILLFHKIIHKTIPVELPNYIILAPQSNLRSSHNDPLTFVSIIKPRINKKAQTKVNKLKKNTITCKTTTKTKCQVKGISKKLKARNKKAKKFFKKRMKSEKIYQNEDDKNDEFSEMKVFKSSYFYRTHIVWNNLPLEIKVIESYDRFKNNLEAYLWKIVDVAFLDNDQDTNESLIGLPGD